MSLLDRIGLHRISRPQPPVASPMRDSIAERIEELVANRKPEDYSEIKRIVGLPIVCAATKEEEEAFNRHIILPRAYREGFRLKPPQVNAMLSYMEYGGTLCAIGVGWGKTLIALYIDAQSMKKGHERVLHLLPKRNYRQLVKTDIPWARARVWLDVQFHELAVGPDARRWIISQPPPGVYLMPYSLLSASDGEDLIRAIEPTVVVCDEAHELRHMKTARTKRFMRFVREKNPEMHVLSGTITAKGLGDYHHLAVASLHKRCPMPISTMLAFEWAAVIDADADPTDSQTGPIMPLVRWARDHFPGEIIALDKRAFRMAYQLRLRHAPGVITTGDAEIGSSLVIVNEPVPDYKQHEDWPELERLMKQVDDLWLTPNGDEIDYAIHCYKWRYELSAGFYNEHYWETPEELADRKGIAETRAKDMLERAREQLLLQNQYNKEVRGWLTTAPQGVDTPLLIDHDIRHNGGKRVPSVLVHYWQMKEDAKFEGMPERLKRAKRICGYKVEQAVRFAQTQLIDGCIFWYHNIEIGRWLFDLMEREYGVEKVIYCPAGKVGVERILDPTNKGKLVVASFGAHGSGHNLQYSWSTMYFVQWDRQAAGCEQIIGRLHRQGQEADEVVVVTNHTLDFDHALMASSLNDAAFIEGTGHGHQKLLLASYDPLPAIETYEKLVKLGFQPEALTSQMRRRLVERFQGS